jgi:hypothetical protein
MATFQNSRLTNINTTLTEAYSSTSDSTIVLSILVTNKNGLQPADVTVTQNTGGSIDSYLAFTIPVPNDANLELLANKFVLPSGKSIRIASSASGYLDATLSVVQV